MSLFDAGLQPALDSDGDPISGAQWLFYLTGTTTPAPVYADAELTTSLGSSETADASGRFVVIFLDDEVTYRAVLKDAGGTTIKDIDPANSESAEVTITRLLTAALAGRDVWLPDKGVSSDVADNSPVIEAAFEEVGYGRKYWLPHGDVPITTDLVIPDNLDLEGHGHAPSGGTTFTRTNGAKIVVDYAPGGNDAFRSKLGRFKFTPTAKRSSVGTCNYNAGTRTGTITGGSVAPVVGDVLWIEAAGPSTTLPGRTGDLNNLESTVGVTTLGGNPGVYIGQWIDLTGASLPAATKVLARGTDTISLSNNAGATVNDAPINVRWRLYARVVSVAGSTFVTDAGDGSQNVTGAAFGYADPGIDLKRTAHLHNIAFAGEMNTNIFSRADSSYGTVANSSLFEQIDFGSSSEAGQYNAWGLVLAGWDVNASAVRFCDFSFVRVGLFSDALIDLKVLHSHFAFNTGFVNVRPNSQVSLTDNYIEDSTAMFGNSTGDRASGNGAGIARGLGFDVDVPWGAGRQIGPLRAQYLQIDEPLYGVSGAQLLNATRGAAITNPTGGATVDAEARTALIALLDRLRASTGHGLIA